MEKKKIMLQYHDGRMFGVDAWIDDSFPSLAVMEAKRLCKWEIQHIPTGMRVAAGFPTKKSAIACAQDLCNIGDWNFGDVKSKPNDTEFLKNIPVIGRIIVNEIIKKHGGYR